MKKIMTFALAAMMLASCTPTPQETATDAVSAVSELMLSRRSIRQYKDEPISRELLDDILNLGLNAPNGKNRQAYEIRVLGSTTIDAVTAAVVNDNPQLAERPGFKNIFVNANALSENKSKLLTPKLSPIATFRGRDGCVYVSFVKVFCL